MSLILLSYGCTNPDVDIRTTEKPKYDQTVKTSENCIQSGNSCLILIDSYFIKGEFENSIDIRGELENIGIGTTNHPWHGVEITCYDGSGRVIDTTGAPVDKLQPGESGVFEQTMFDLWAHPKNCKTKILY